jgi:RNase adapter protein RapZ
MERRSAMELVLITGMSGSGKSVALHALEDAGYYCVDNLPPELLLQFVMLEQEQKATRIAIAMDVRSANALPMVPQQLQTLRKKGIEVKSLFLDSTAETLVRRYSESRRRHPLSQSDPTQSSKDERRALVDAIELERELLSEIREQSHVIDTSIIRPSQLQGYVKTLISAKSGQLTLAFESFAFKRGVPTDADFVFDVRMLPNPHYEAELRALTGRDEPVVEFLKRQPEVGEMLRQIDTFLNYWLESLARDHRSYVTVAIGCTGGQHRSVYIVEELAESFSRKWATLKRHRELDSMPGRFSPTSAGWLTA